VVHVSVPPPVCDGCTKDGSLSCNLACPRCKRLVTSRSTTIPQLFAILRQWEPATQVSLRVEAPEDDLSFHLLFFFFLSLFLLQDNVDLIVAEMFKKGLNVDDRDSLTDMTVLHFACKAGGIGDPKKSARLVEDLLRRNADVTLAPKWTQMTPLHLAAFFSNAPAITVLMPKAQAIISATCTEWKRKEGRKKEKEERKKKNQVSFPLFLFSRIIITAATIISSSFFLFEVFSFFFFSFPLTIIVSSLASRFEGATPLHLAALAGSVQAVHTLLRHGADSGARDAHRRTPLDCAKFMASQQTDISQSAWTTIISQV
jgi:hypothetical protein